jgi:hypothetical protein
VRLFATAFFLTFAALGWGSEEKPGVCTVEVVDRFFNPNAPAQFRHVIKLMEEDPSLEVKMWSGLKLPGGGSRAPIIMAIAGETAPDILDSWFHVIRNDIHQGFLYSLNHWIGDDLNGNGEIDPDEARWEGWKNIPELWRKVATVDGKVYGLPQPGRSMMGVLFRTDLARNAGLDPDSPPKTWEEFFVWAMKLSDPGRAVPGRNYNEGQKGVALVPHGFTWLPQPRAANVRKNAVANRRTFRRKRRTEGNGGEKKVTKRDAIGQGKSGQNVPRRTAAQQMIQNGYTSGRPRGKSTKNH